RKKRRARANKEQERKLEIKRKTSIRACTGATRSAMVLGQFNLLALAQRAAGSAQHATGSAQHAAYPCSSIFFLLLAQRASWFCATRGTLIQG
ncbi:hypothetical protein A2U01_0021564, partial [Trifolium medium]|nr:hypothetical protein [Trifolium medium]